MEKNSEQKQTHPPTQFTRQPLRSLWGAMQESIPVVSRPIEILLFGGEELDERWLFKLKTARQLLGFLPLLLGRRGWGEEACKNASSVTSFP